jgi:hypothetical protein
LWQLAAAQGYRNLFSQGACESIDGWSSPLTGIVADSENKYEGTNCIKVSLDAGRTTGNAEVSVLSLLNTSKYYLFSGYVKNGNLTNGISVRAYCYGDALWISSSNNSSNEYVRLGVVLQPSDFDGASDVIFVARLDGLELQYAYFDAYMINEISAADYASGAAACLAKYPYKSP